MALFRAKNIAILAIGLIALIATISFLLNNIVYRANPVRLSSYLAPQSLVAQPGTPITQYLVVQIDRPTHLASLEFEITYDRTRLDYQSFLPELGWKIYKQKSQDGLINLLITPTDGTGRLRQVSGEVVIGSLLFSSLAEGRSVVRINPDATVIMAFDAASAPSIYNVSLTTQESIVTISTDLPPTVSPTPQAPVAARQEIGLGQRIVSQDVITGYSSAAILPSLKHPARVRLHFGKTLELGSEILSNEVSANPVLRLFGLNESTQYFYQLTIIERASQIVSPIRTFTTGQRSVEGSVDYARSELVISPNLATSVASAFLVLRDNEGKIVETPPQFKIIEGAITLTQPVDFGGIQISTIESRSKTKQSAKIGLIDDVEKKLVKTVTFDPDLTENQSPPTEDRTVLKIDNRTIAVILLLIVVLILSGFSLAKMARSR